MKKQIVLTPDESEGIETPNQWEVEQGFIKDRLED